MSVEAISIYYKTIFDYETQLILKELSVFKTPTYIIYMYMSATGVNSILVYFLKYEWLPKNC